MKKKKKGELELRHEKKKNIIMRHKLLFLISMLACIVLGIMFYIFFSLVVGGNDPYGDRLKGIKSVEISKSDMKKYSDQLSSKDGVASAKVRRQGKIIYIHIKVNGDVSLDRAKAVANESLEMFSDKEKKYYDFGYFLSQDKDDGFIITGSKNSNSSGIVWIKS